MIIARGVDPDLMTNKLDITDQPNSSVATGGAECRAAVTKIDRIKLKKGDLLRVLRRAARVGSHSEGMQKRLAHVITQDYSSHGRRLTHLDGRLNVLTRVIRPRLMSRQAAHMHMAIAHIANSIHSS